MEIPTCSLQEEKEFSQFYLLRYVDSMEVYFFKLHFSFTVTLKNVVLLKIMIIIVTLIEREN